MSRFSMAGACTAFYTVLLMANAAHPVTPAAKCEAAKLKIAGKYDFCRLKAEATAAKTGTMLDFSNCDSAYSANWAQAEMKAGGMCPSSGDQATVQAFLTQGTTSLGVALAGAPLPACGNGVIDPGEQCDQSNLNGQTCASQGFAVGTLKCGAGCVFDTSGCSASRFVDNGDGTVSDLQTGLMWEKKTLGECVNLVGGHPIACSSDADCTGNGGGGTCVPCLHCVNATYTWTSSGSPFPPDGTTFTDFLYQLDNCASDGFTQTGGFAGHCDWRIPTIEELDSIIDVGMEPACYTPGSGVRCIDPTFGPTQGDNYWSSMTDSGEYAVVPGDAAVVAAFGEPTGLSFSIGFAKTSSTYVRAVRGGS